MQIARGIVRFFTYQWQGQVAAVRVQGRLFRRYILLHHYIGRRVEERLNLFRVRGLISSKNLEKLAKHFLRIPRYHRAQ